MIKATIQQDNPILKAVINQNNSVIFGKIIQNENSIKASITPQGQELHAYIFQRTETESYYETGNEAGGNTIIIGD